MNPTRSLSVISAVAVVVAGAALVGCNRKDDSISKAETASAPSASGASGPSAVATGPGPGIAQTKAIAQDGYIYALPLIGAYKAMYQFNVDKTSSQYKGPFNVIVNEARVFTPKDTTIVTPNSDTPYSALQADLRAEPIVLCVPKVDKSRYYSVQITDMYTHNIGYVGSRTTGSDAGCYMLAGPSWKGETPPGIKQVFSNETQFGLVIYRTQLFNPKDMDNVKKVQAGYSARPLSAFLKTAAPPAAPEIKWLPFTEEAFKTEFPTTLDFLLQFAPEVPQDKEIRAKLASIGIGSGKTFDFKDLSDLHKVEVGLGVKDGYAAIEKRRASFGKEINGWNVGGAGGDRAFYNGDYLKLAAVVLLGIYANSPEEAMYPAAKADDKGQALDGSKHKYTLTFAKGEFPPVNAFWSVTMYDGKSQLLIDNPINRYLINSPMLSGMKKNADGSLTLYIQNGTPGKDKESNWLPAPNDGIYMIMRLYSPKETPPSILPPEQGTWKPPVIVQVQ